jgi:phosphatidylinositol alpha-1,6-mannosyltransferase
LSNRINVSNYLTFHGQAKDRETLASFYKSCDIFIMLSENQPNGDVEGFGIAILEANYFGKPAIGARGCGIEAAIKNHYNGILVNGDNTSEILNAIQEILTHQKYYEAQPKTWSIKHNWDEIVENIIE